MGKPLISIPIKTNPQPGRATHAARWLARGVFDQPIPVLTLVPRFGPLTTSCHPAGMRAGFPLNYRLDDSPDGDMTNEISSIVVRPVSRFISTNHSNLMKKPTNLPLLAALAISMPAILLASAGSDREAADAPLAVDVSVPADVTPCGSWVWQNGSKIVVINEDKTVGKNHKEAEWEWIDQEKRTLQINWAEGWIDKLAIARDGQKMAVVNNLGWRFLVHRLPEENDFEPPVLD